MINTVEIKRLWERLTLLFSFRPMNVYLMSLPSVTFDWIYIADLLKNIYWKKPEIPTVPKYVF